MRAPSTLDKGQWPPDYVSVFAWRQAQVLKLREAEDLQFGAREYYRRHPVEFINHWCNTYDPRNAGGPTPPRMPFVLFQRQQQLVQFLSECLKSQESGLVEKSRDMGATWVCASVSIWLWLFWPGSAIGWGSRKEALVDKIGDPDSIFEKMRIVLRGLPRELWPAGLKPDEHLTSMRFVNPETDATIIGEIGDNIGRGGRKLIYFKDESAHYERPEKIEAALSDNTRCQIDISSVNGVGNVFHRKREAGVEWQPDIVLPKGKTRVFVMDWRDHPAKTQDWYDQRRVQARDNGLLHVFAQEVDRDYSAAVEGVVIPPEWVKAAIDAHVKLKFDDSGGWCAALDVADEGLDTNALVKRKGVILKSCEEWGERDTGVTARRAVKSCEGLGLVELQYDCIGVGAGIKAETNRLVDEGLMPKTIRLVPWNAGAEVLNPDGHVVDGDQDSPLNRDFYANLKAQGWWELRRRFEKTWRAINEPGFTWKADELISLPSTLPLLRKIEKELSQPTAGQGARLKLLINKSPSGTRSPNLADAIMMAYWPNSEGAPMVISAEFAAAYVSASRRR